MLDPFSGSGTTVIAAERLARKARVIEIDPHYCDVIIRRWHKAVTPRRRTALGNNDRRLTVLHPRRRFLSLTAGAAAFPAAVHMAWGQAYPTRPITIVVPFAVGAVATLSPA